MSCGVGCRHCLDLTLLWLWFRPVAIALIQPLAWEPPDAVDVALKRPKKKKKIEIIKLILMMSVMCCIEKGRKVW